MKALKPFFAFILTLVVIFPSVSRGQFYELKNVLSSRVYSNVVLENNALYAGSSDGVYTINPDGTLSSYDQSIQGYITNKITPADESNIEFKDDFNSLLPLAYQTNKNTFASTNNLLVVASRGTLFIFQKSFYSLQPYQSVRSISENYVGTYGGVFKNGVALDYPKFTDGKIKEFDHSAFICYNGLLVDYKNGQTKDFVSTLNYEFSVSGKSFGFVYDAEEIKHPEYLLFSTRGLVHLNLETEQAYYVHELFQKNHNSSSRVYGYVGNERGKVQVENIYFYSRTHYLRYNTSNKKIDSLLRFEVPIKDILVKSDIANFYALDDKNELSLYEINIGLTAQIKGQKKISSHQNTPHSLSILGDYIFVRGDNGLDLVNATTSETYRSVINDELNKLASYHKKDTLYLGGVLGLYTIPKDQLLDYIGNKVLFKPEEGATVVLWTNYVFILIILLLISTILYLVFVVGKKSPKSDKNELKQAIDQHINDNLATVSITSLLSNFNLSNSELYKIMAPNKPGNHIRTLRLEKLKKLRGLNASDDEIAKITGFSKSYLKKI